MKKTLNAFLIFLFLLCISTNVEARKCRDEYNHYDIVAKSQQIVLKEYPTGWNPSIIKTEHGYLLSFRYTPNMKNHWISYTGLALLDENFEQIDEAYLLTEDLYKNPLYPHMEDARLFSDGDDHYLVFNCCIDKVHRAESRRDMWIAKLYYLNDMYHVDSPTKLLHSENHLDQLTEKNWVPFSWKKNILFSYMVNPHEVIYPSMRSGECSPIYITKEDNVKWKWGKLRGGTPAILIGDEYLAFFHSSIKTHSLSSGGEYMHHYYMGAYTFSAEPPFEMKKITPYPIVGKDFYTLSKFNKRVIFPGGLVEEGEHFLVAYGKDDSEIWIAKVDRKKLVRSLKPIEDFSNN